jgi:DNA-binding CsgD family transcriptional regulator
MRDDRAIFDVVRDEHGELAGYACSVLLSPISQDDAGDPAIALAIDRLRAAGWFGLDTPPDARTLVLRDWSAVGAHRDPSPSAALLLAQIACRLLTTSALDFHVLLTDRPAHWLRALRGFGLVPQIAGALRQGDVEITAVVTDWRWCSVSTLLQNLTAAASRADVLARVVATEEAVGDPAPTDSSGRQLARALECRLAQLASTSALSPREQEVLHLLLLGRNYAEIGLALRITPRTARFHQHNVLEKIGAESRLDILRLLM